MKQYEYEEISDQLTGFDLANIFNVYEDKKISPNYYSYNINRTMNIIGKEAIAPDVYEEYIVSESDTWTKIAYIFYGSHRLWWLVCKMNEIHDPTELPEHGTVLKLLKETYITTLLENIRLN